MVLAWRGTRQEALGIVCVPRIHLGINSKPRDLPSEFNQYWGKYFVLVFTIMFLYSSEQLMKKIYMSYNEDWLKKSW